MALAGFHSANANFKEMEKNRDKMERKPIEAANEIRIKRKNIPKYQNFLNDTQKLYGI